MRACYDLWQAPGFCRSFEPYSGAVEAIDALEEVMDVYIVTSPMRSPTWVHERSEWLSEHFGIPRNRQVHTQAKYLVSGDLFIDDNPEHVKEWAEHNPRGMPVLWDRPYNQHPVTIRGPWIRAKTWEDVWGHIERLGLCVSK